MASTINADTSNGVVVTSDTSGEIELQSAGSTKVTIKSNGDVGIGTLTPSFETVAGTGLEVRNAGGLGGHLKLTDSASGAGGSNGFDLYAFNTSGYIENYESGATVFRNNGGESMRIKANGDIEFGNFTTDGGGTGVSFEVGGSSAPEIYSSAIGTATRVHYQFYNNNGAVGKISTNGTATTFATSSDYRLKENNVSITNGIERVKLLKPYRFNFIADADKIVDGFYAHETQTVVPESVVGTKDAMRTEEYEVTPAVLDDGNIVTEAVMGTREVPDYQGIDQSKLVPLLTAALQEAVTKIEDLETRIKALENA